MEAWRSTVILVCIILYLGMCIGVGLWALRRTKTTKDFFMAGRHLGVLVTSVAVFSSTMSGFGFVGGPGLVYRMGVSSLWIVISTPIGFAISFFLLAKRIRLFAELRDSTSLPDVVQARYSSRAPALLTAIAILLGVLGYLATQILAMARVLQGILAGIDAIGSVRLEYCVLVSCAVLVFYCVTGGIIASVYTDVVQGAVMMIAAVLVFFAAMHAVDGGFAGMSRTILEDDPEAIGPWGTLGMFGCLSWYFVFVLGGAGQPHVITKLMMTKNVRDARHMLPISVFGYAVTALLWISIGLVMRTLVLQGLHPELPTADAAAPQFLRDYTHPVLAGVVFAGLLAAIMSTADSFLNIGAAAVVHDIPRALLGSSLKNELFWARVATGIIAVVASVFALYTGGLVALLGAFGWGTFAAAIVPTVAIGFNWKRATPLAACVAIVASLLANFTIHFLATNYGMRIPGGIDGGAVSLLLSLTLFIGISLATPQKPLDPAIEAVMDL
jgi:SSS family transporter